MFSQQWTWLDGTNNSTSLGVYQGDQSQIQPGPRKDAAYAGPDENGNSWVFGGFGNSENGTNGRYDA